MVNKKDRVIIRQLAQEVARIAALPVQEEKKRLWRKLNGLNPERPMVTIDQVCWNEMNVDDELTLLCTSPECREWEQHLRMIIYQWRHFPVDMVVEPFVRVPKAIENSGFGIVAQEDTIATDSTNPVRAHAYKNQFTHDEDIEKVQMPVITHDEAETERRLALAHELFAGILDISPQGMDPYLSVWDTISNWMGVQEILYALIDRPEFMLELARKMVAGYMSMLDQLEEQGLLCHSQALIHCTGAFTDDLPAPGFNPEKPRTKDIWMFGLAQMFSTVSPAMFEEYEIETSMPLFERFGLVYYGCCDPLENKMEQVRRIPNLRKISMSPWVDERKGAEEIGRDYVFSRKPSPSMLAFGSFDEQEVRKHLQTSIDICREHGCPLELILKDISTVKYQPQRLWRWAEIAMELVEK